MAYRVPTEGEREDALRDAAYEEFRSKAEKCEDCGGLWDPRKHRATLTDPAYEEAPECPACGGQREEHPAPAEGGTSYSPEAGW